MKLEISEWYARFKIVMATTRDELKTLIDQLNDQTVESLLVIVRSLALKHTDAISHYDPTQDRMVGGLDPYFDASAPDFSSYVKDIVAGRYGQLQKESES